MAIPKKICLASYSLSSFFKRNELIEVAYRALRFARRDSIDLPGFDENQFVLASNANQRNYNLLLEEFTALRRTTVYLYNSFSDAALLEIGKIDGNKMSVRALGYLTSGHLLHHLHVIKNRYL